MPDDSNPSAITTTREELEWLSALTGLRIKDVEATPVAAAAEQYEEERRLKEEALGKVRAMQEILRDRIASGTDVKVQMKGGKTKAMKVKDHDPLKEYDTGHHADKTVGLTEEDSDKAYAALGDVAEMADVLRNCTITVTDENGQETQKALFDDKTIAEAVHTPLLRQGVIPENLIPPAYSRFQKHFEGANALYDEKLQEFTDSQTRLDRIAGKMQMLSEWLTPGLGAVASAASTPAKMVEDVKKSLEADIDEATKAAFDRVKDHADDAAKMATCLTYLPKALGYGATGLTKLQQADRKIKEKVGEAVTKAVNKLTHKPPADVDVGAHAAEIVEKAVKSGRFLSLVQEGRTHDAMAELSDIASAQLAALDTPRTGAFYEMLGRSLAAAMASAAEKARTVDDLVAQGKGEEAVAALSGAIGAALTQRIGQDDAALSEAAAKISSGAGADAVKGLQAAEDEIMMRAAELEGEETSRLLDEAMHVFDGQAKDVETNAANTVSAVLKKVQDTQTKLQWAEKVTVFITKQGINGAAKAFTTAGKIFGESVPGLGDAAAAANTLRDIVIESLKAARAAGELVKWKDNLKKAKLAVSPVLDAIHNVVGARVWDLLKRGIDIAFNLAKLVGQVVAAIGGVVGTGVPQAQAAVVAGKATTYAAEAGRKGLQAILTYSRKVKVERAWRTYKQARDNPYDRILMHRSLRSNPTLAKYSIAYGAIEEQDPVAIKVMNGVGLNDEALENENAKATEVVEYLETLYSDDPKLIRALPKKRDWHPKEPLVFTVKSWIAHVEAAKKAGLADKRRTADSVTGPLTALAWRVKAFETAAESDASLKADIETAGTALKETYAAIRTALSCFKPHDADGNPHQEMQEVVDFFLARCEEREAQFLDAYESALARAAERQEQIEAYQAARTRRRRRGGAAAPPRPEAATA